MLSHRSEMIAMFVSECHSCDYLTNQTKGTEVVSFISLLKCFAKGLNESHTLVENALGSHHTLYPKK